MAQVILRNDLQGPEFLDRILKTVSKFTGVSEGMIMIKTRRREVVQARQICMYFARLMTNCSTSKIGETFGMKDHATVLHADKVTQGYIDVDRKFRGHIFEMKLALENYITNIDDTLLVCEQCGGINIQTKAWVDPNSNNVIELYETGDSDDNWCNKCEAHTRFMLKSEFNKMRADDAEYEEVPAEQVSEKLPTNF